MIRIHNYSGCTGGVPARVQGTIGACHISEFIEINQMQPLTASEARAGTAR
jgi:hypothetical protein